MSRFIANIKDKKVGILVSLFVVFSLTVLGLYAIKYFGTQYTEEALQKQLDDTGLTPFVHYQTVHFNPFTLTPSIEEVSFGFENSPWLQFSRISLNSYPLTYPDLDVDFWIKNSPAENLSYDTSRLMKVAGITTLLGKGSLSSKVNKDQVTSQFKLDIKDLGILSTSSHIRLLNNELSMHEIRTDLLASIAMGQPLGLFFIHGEALEISDLDIRYQDSGLVTRLIPEAPKSQQEEKQLASLLKFISQSLGVAKANSVEADEIANALVDFLKPYQDPSLNTQANKKQLRLQMSPSKPLSLQELALMAHETRLYKDSNMRLTH
ncbi:hypothetical protein [Marinomonas sp. GJ51-6]|uniref:hypothetical protein n=1 Tax=Marinomonas sp. GJ51-6 TaxID=2992802 RepID=UPI00293415C4|nr:hypothetical protein [Marinomonas sp. GJ51-6]WOD06239.1 hypothetical protein ONZ50_10890 [Marinomonas sp. GJ51-6]